MLIKTQNQHGGDIYTNQVRYDFSANISPLGTPDFIKQSIIESAEKVTAYPDPYCSELRIALASYEKVNKDHIICGNGAAEIIYSLVNAQKPQKAMIVIPTFCEYENVLRTLECQICYYTLKEYNNYQITEEFLKEMNQTIDMIFICNPNNPTGQLIDQSLMIQIAKKCKEYNTILFCDECFMDLTQNPKEYSIVKEINHNPNLFLLKAFTKSFGMAGVRLGYGLTSNEELLSKMTTNTQLWNVSTIAQLAGQKAIENIEFLDQVRTIIQIQRDYLTKELQDLGYQVIESKVNFILFQGETDLYEKLMKEKIMIRKCDNFHGLNKNYYRCAIKTQNENEELIKTLKFLKYK